VRCSPGLDRLRDAAAEGAFDVVAVYSTDRLARKYAYRVLLLEELRKASCEVAFAQRPISDAPHDQAARSSACSTPTRPRSSTWPNSRDAG
jgi:DNA invertase Pin-like site-specific DNA recombinase